MKREKNAGLGTLAALALAIGCAGTQKVSDQSGAGAEGGATMTGGGSAGADPMVVAQPTQVEKRDISEDAQEAFDKATEKWQKARKDGSLKTKCADLAEDFEDIAKDHPNIPEARHNQAALLFECGKEAEATKLWEQLAGGAKPYAPALSSLGYLAWKKGDLGRAETLFDRAVKADPFMGSVSARLNLAQILRDKSRQAGSTQEKLQYNEQAIGHLRRALAVDGSNLRAYAILCYFYYDLKLPDMAVLVGNQAVARAEEIATGKFSDQKGDLAANEAPAKKGRGKKGKEEAGPKKGKEITVEGTGYTPDMKKNLGMVHNTLGLVWLKKKNVSTAIASFKKAIENDPELSEARMNLAALSLNFRDYKTAEDNFREVLKADAKNYEALVGLGVALRGNRKFDEAEQQYNAATQVAPQKGDAFFNLGILYQEYKGTDEAALKKAQGYYRDFIAKGGNSAKRRDAEKRIKDIDEMIAALKEAEKMQAEAEEIQRKAEEQQKKMEEELKKMQEMEKQQGGAGAAPASPAGGAGPTSAK